MPLVRSSLMRLFLLETRTGPESFPELSKLKQQVVTTMKAVANMHLYSSYLPMHSHNTSREHYEWSIRDAGNIYVCQTHLISQEYWNHAPW